MKKLQKHIEAYIDYCCMWLAVDDTAMFSGLIYVMQPDWLVCEHGAGVRSIQKKHDHIAND